MLLGGAVTPMSLATISGFHRPMSARIAGLQQNSVKPMMIVPNPASSPNWEKPRNFEIMRTKNDPPVTTAATAAGLPAFTSASVIATS